MSRELEWARPEKPRRTLAKQPGKTAMTTSADEPERKRAECDRADRNAQRRCVSHEKSGTL